MTRRDSITRRRAKDLWTGSSREASGSALPRGRVLSARTMIGGSRVRLWPCISLHVLAACWRRSRLNSRLKPYWGKPAVRNFRGGGEDTGTRSALIRGASWTLGSSCFSGLLCRLSTRGLFPSGSVVHADSPRVACQAIGTGSLVARGDLDGRRIQEEVADVVVHRPFQEVDRLAGLDDPSLVEQHQPIPQPAGLREDRG